MPTTLFSFQSTGRQPKPTCDRASRMPHLRVAMFCGSILACSSVGAQSIHAQEREQCLQGSSNQPQSTCLKEAGAARAEARRQGLRSPTPNEARDNALARCDVFADSGERQACESRTLSPSAQTGSVQEGGVTRESIEVLRPQPLPSPENRPLR